MENILNLEQIKGIKNEIMLDLNNDLQINRSKREFTNMTQNIVSRGADYVIKAMPVNNNIKEILLDVKEAFKTKDFKKILGTAVNSCVREGIEMLNFPINVLKDINKVKEITLKGGLREGISSAIDIVTNKYLKGNLFAVHIKDFINQLKNFVFSNKFTEKLDMGIRLFKDKANEYQKLCQSWHEAYQNKDFEKMDIVAKTLNTRQRSVNADSECVRQNRIIQNITEAIHHKKEELSPIQLKICNIL